CVTYNVEHELITSWQQLLSKLNPLPTHGIRVLELRTNRKVDALWVELSANLFNRIQESGGASALGGNALLEAPGVQNSA
ncbi:hypothetical protein G7B40_041580, partial [Aetokthonos hydrillicola Thurmond2011]